MNMKHSSKLKFFDILDAHSVDKITVKYVQRIFVKFAKKDMFIRSVKNNV